MRRSILKLFSWDKYRETKREIRYVTNVVDCKMPSAILWYRWTCRRARAIVNSLRFALHATKGAKSCKVTNFVSMGRKLDDERFTNTSRGRRGRGIGENRLSASYYAAQCNFNTAVDHA